MPLIPFPDVPQVPGVPAVFRDLTIPTLPQLANIALGGLADLIFGTPPWGVFTQDGDKVLFPDSFLGIRFRNDARVANAPLEAGSFSSYNKVQTPFDAVLRMAISADVAARQTFLGTVGALVQSTDLYAVVTPEISYGSVNMVGYNYSRTERQGTTLLVVEMAFQEIRQSAVAQFSQVQAPSGANPVNDGQVQAIPVPDSGPLQATPLEAIQ
ncbi:hypothetical protein [Bordetella genomosp. 11]|uniref:Phage tail protein n=1 Tax=Bordetella genomosp. 11 TaxID=1416808 RepID=A0A261UEK8_9BORD|nr:hypothetical protein [Bordetella genomosp. 11]OZI59947.1 hypothetical protein CAL28_10715 [Bordetella genomosp. 11]